jgi:hypothetical protein
VLALLLPVDGIKGTSLSVLTKIVISNFGKVHSISSKSVKWFLAVETGRQTWQNCWAYYCSIDTYASELAACSYKYEV